MKKIAHFTIAGTVTSATIDFAKGLMDLGFTITASAFTKTSLESAGVTVQPVEGEDPPPCIYVLDPLSIYENVDPSVINWECVMLLMKLLGQYSEQRIVFTSDRYELILDYLRKNGLTPEFVAFGAHGAIGDLTVFLSKLSRFFYGRLPE